MLMYVLKYTHLRTLHFLQLILQMQTRLQALNILNKPEHILMFIQHALETSPTSNGVNGAEDSDADSDDDTPNSVLYTADNEVIETSVNLLLSVLEGKCSLVNSVILALIPYSQSKLVCENSTDTQHHFLTSRTIRI